MEQFRIVRSLLPEIQTLSPEDIVLLNALDRHSTRFFRHDIAGTTSVPTLQVSQQYPISGIEHPWQFPRQQMPQQMASATSIGSFPANIESHRNMSLSSALASNRETHLGLLSLCSEIEAERLLLLRNLGRPAEYQGGLFGNANVDSAEGSATCTNVASAPRADCNSLGESRPEDEGSLYNRSGTGVKMPAEGKEKKVRRKSKDKPRRPLSAYNVFFKEERERILAGIPGYHTPSVSEGRSRRTRKQPPHRKIGFESLAKVIGARWRDLPPGRHAYYKNVASEDMKRYKKEMDEYLAGKAAKIPEGTSSRSVNEDDASVSS